jgi:hypothetical protein
MTIETYINKHKCKITIRNFKNFLIMAQELLNRFEAK